MKMIWIESECVCGCRRQMCFQSGHKWCCGLEEEE